MTTAPLVIGCQGCRRDQISSEQSDPSNVRAVVSKPMRSYPHSADEAALRVKAGHWMTVSQAWQANEEDVRGELAVSASNIEQGRPESIEAIFHSARPAMLPRGQSKSLETRLLIPRGAASENSTVWLHSRLRAPNTSTTSSSPQRGRYLAPSEYFFVVLTSRATQFSQLQNSSWARTLVNGSKSQPPIRYRLVFPENKGTLPLPETFFEWTSIAYVLWDDLRPEDLTPAQRRAFIDWIHWGGQVIFNGPSSGESISNSDLGWLLPFEQVRVRALASAELRGIIENWSLPTDRGAAALQATLDDGVERTGLEGRLVKSATVAAPSSLVWERQHGGGTVRITGFDLTNGWLRNWGSYDSFFNSVLLRRPPRVYEANNGELVQYFAGELRGKERDARLSTRLRLFSRDTFFPVGGAIGQPVDQQTASIEASGRLVESSAARAGEKTSERGERAADLVNRRSGVHPAGTESRWLAGYRRTLAGEDVGSWNEANDVATAALAILRDEAGIDVPNRGFVLKALGIYLIVLIPINYAFFWLLGRQEWAWMSIPFIGIGGAIWVVREAQLDIGFARSRTEIAVVELQPGYERAVMTRYMALYNSLGTSYRIDFPSREIVGAPVGVLDQAKQSVPCVFQQGLGGEASLGNVFIPSNQTLVLHTEQMVELSGSLQYEETADESGEITTRLVNETGLELTDVILIRKDDMQRPESKYVASILPQERLEIRWTQRPAVVPEGLQMGAERLYGAWINAGNLSAGAVRMVGRVDEEFSELEMTPAASQNKVSTLVVANLRNTTLPPATSDINMAADISQAMLDQSAGESLERLDAGENQ